MLGARLRDGGKKVGKKKGGDEYRRKTKGGKKNSRGINYGRLLRRVSM